MEIVDLRSDTVTLPTAAMREAMYRAEVGDDVYGEDPTINRLEEMAAARMGKEAALFVVSGTMANLVSLLTHCGRGDEVIMGELAHTFHYEVGGSSALGGLHVRAVPNQPDGSLDPQDTRAPVLSAWRIPTICVGEPFFLRRRQTPSATWPPNTAWLCTSTGRVSLTPLFSWALTPES
jgi:threonine aldolase